MLQNSAAKKYMLPQLMVKCMSEIESFKTYSMYVIFNIYRFRFNKKSHVGRLVREFQVIFIIVIFFDYYDKYDLKFAQKASNM
jgi:hypothetical protein